MAAGGAAADQPHGGFLIEALGSFTGLRPVMQDSIHDLAKSHVGAVDPEIRHLVALDEAAHLVVSIIRKDLVPQIRIIRVALDDALAASGRFGEEDDGEVRFARRRHEIVKERIIFACGIDGEH